MVRNLIMLFLVISYSSTAQQESFIKPGLLKATGTISPSKMLARNMGNYYVSGFAEYYVEKNLSFRGDTYLFVTGSDEVAFFSAASRTFFGLQYHLNWNNFDLNFGFQPGISYQKRNPYMDGIETFAPETERGQVMPSVALSFGATYYVWKYFNFFANASYVRSDLHGTLNGSYNTDELIFSAGLGFQIQTLKK